MATDPAAALTHPADAMECAADPMVDLEATAPCAAGITTPDGDSKWL